MADMTIATTIADQIGRRALFMIGAKDLVGGENFLMFKIMRNKSGANKIKITLNASDTYDIEFISIRGTSCKVKDRREGIYFDSLHDVIGRVTGLALSL